MPSIEERVEQLEVQVRGLLDEMDTVVRFRRTLAETRDNLKALTEVVNELSINMTNGFAATATKTDLGEIRAEFAELRTDLRTEVTSLRTDMNKGFEEILKRFD
jgi:BMFP domain-containing protein YqiC